MTLFNYIGGKTWLREHLREKIQHNLNAKQIDTYIEPFAGGLGAFLNIYDILHTHNIKRVILNDINSKLINFYKIVQTNPDDLIEEYLKLETLYSKTIPQEAYSLHKTKDKIKIKQFLEKSNFFYKKIRNQFNSTQTELDNATHLLFLQNHCFNGVYRENSQGQYNTPFNWDSKIFNEDNIKTKILNVHKIFNTFDIEFSNKSFIELEYNSQSFYYLDPPYINDNIQENKYNKDSFEFNKQKKLIQKIKNTSFLYSNHYNEKIIEEFKIHKIPILVYTIPRKNIISSSNESRKIDKIEILVSSI